MEGERYRKLLEKVSNVGLFQLNFLEKLELLGYQSQLKDFVFWNSKDDYFQLLEALYTRDIGLEEFSYQFLNMYDQDSNTFYLLESNLNQLSKVEISSESIGFYELIYLIWGLFEAADCEVDDGYNDTESITTELQTQLINIYLEYKPK